MLTNVIRRNWILVVPITKTNYGEYEEKRIMENMKKHALKFFLQKAQRDMINSVN